MAEYKRLITYAYSYESGLKKHNVGHARVEVYGSELKVKVNIKAPSYSEKVLKVYFYKRISGGLKTSYFCDVSVPNGSVDEKFQTKTNNLGDSSLQFHELDGFVLFFNPAKCIVFDLKDQVLTNEEIHNIGMERSQVKSSLSNQEQEKEVKEDKIEQNSGNVALGESKKLENLTELTENYQNEETKVYDNDAEPIEDAEGIETEVYDNSSQPIEDVEGIETETYDSSAEPIEDAQGIETETYDNSSQTIEDAQGIETENNDNSAEPIENAEGTETGIYDNSADLIEDAEGTETGIYDNSADLIEDAGKETDVYDNSAETIKSVAREVINDPPTMSEEDTNTYSDNNEMELFKSIASKIAKNVDKTSNQSNNLEQSTYENHVREESSLKPNEPETWSDVAAANTKAKNQGIFANVDEAEGLRQEVPFPWRDTPEARRILNEFPRVYPFEDGEIAECVKIEPKDIGLLPMNHWGAGNNSFLLHGYNNYHHLLFAKKQTRNGCLYLLMVPGIYNAREKYMARLFGFEYFKCAKRRNLREGEFGYWYLTIQF